MKDFLNKAITVVLPIFSGDELSFTIKTDGSVEFMRNNAIPSIFMHVDITQPLWAFWDIKIWVMWVRYL